MTHIVAWQRRREQEVLAWACQLLAQGERVVLPTETGYVAVASALQAKTVSAEPEEGRWVLAVSGMGSALDWAPALSPLGRRLLRRCWPGPLIVTGLAAEQAGAAQRLPAEVRCRLLAAGLPLHAPEHEVLQEVLRHTPFPLVLRLLGDGTPAFTAEQAATCLGAPAALVVDAGPSPYAAPPTVVQLTGNQWTVRTEGALSRQALVEALICRIVFVCTGNTCRSPLAEALCKQLLAERLGCTVAELPTRGYLVQSAGLAASWGGEAAAEAVAIAQELGADLSQHRSQPVTHDLLAQADYVVAMTRGHLRALNAVASGVGPAPRLLADEDIPDPIGASAEVYRACALQIRQALERFVPQLPEPLPLPASGDA